MKYIKLDSEQIVREIIPEFHPDFPGIPVGQRYAPDFLAACVVVREEDTVEPGMLYDADSGSFCWPPQPQPPEPEQAPDPDHGEEPQA